MTRATFVRKDGLLCGFTLRGHAGAGVSGTDVSVEEPAGCQDILLGLRLHLGQLQQQYPRQLVVETIEAR